MTSCSAATTAKSFDGVIDLKLRTEALAVQLAAEKAVADAARQEAEVANRVEDAVLHRRQPRPAPAPARDGPVRRGAAAAHARARGGAARQQHQRVGRRARGPVLRAARHHPDRQRRRRGQPRAASRWPRSSASSGCIRAGGVREGAERCASAATGTSAIADPLLVERIVRNLVGNAIRYTSDGTVLRQLPAARRAPAAAGVGHGPGHRRRRARARLRGVLPGARDERPATAEQKKGLGLGLAIVKRLGGADGRAARVALRGRARLGVHASSCRSARTPRHRARGGRPARARSASR